MKTKPLCVLFLCIAITAVPLPVCANMAKPIENPVDQKLIFDQTPGISLQEESVIFRFAPDNRNTAWVEVSYMLKNLQDKDQEFNVLFVTPNITNSDFEVFVNSERITSVRLEEDIDLPVNWQAGKREIVIEPMSGKPLDRSPDSYGGSYIQQFSGATFPVKLEANGITQLKVTYRSQSGYYRYEHVISPVYSQLYYLTPAKFWEGEAIVNLRVEFPENAKVAIHSNIPLDRKDRNVFETTLDGIPDSEWLFSYVNSAPLIFGTNEIKRHNTIVTVITALLAAAVFGLWRLHRNNIIAGLLVLPILLLFALTIKFTYSFIFFSYLFAPIIIFVIVGLLVARRINRTS